MTEPRDPAAAGGWHLDKRVPLALIVTLLLFVGGQTIGAVIWATNISSQQGLETEQRVALALRIAALESDRIDTGQRLARVETQINGMADQVKAQNGLLLQILGELQSRPQR